MPFTLYGWIFVAAALLVAAVAGGGFRSPGDSMSEQEAAYAGLARSLLVYHQSQVGYIRRNPGVSGTIDSTTLTPDERIAVRDHARFSTVVDSANGTAYSFVQDTDYLDDGPFLGALHVLSGSPAAGVVVVQGGSRVVRTADHMRLDSCNTVDACPTAATATSAALGVSRADQSIVSRHRDPSKGDLVSDRIADTTNRLSVPQGLWTVPAEVPTGAVVLVTTVWPPR